MDSSILSKQYQKPAFNILADVCAKAAKMNNVIDLSVGDPNFTTSQEIIDYAFAKAKAGMTHYTEAEGLPELRQTICDYYASKYQTYFDKDQVLVTIGAQHALFIALEALLDPGDEVIIPLPYWVSYGEQIKLSDGKPVFVKPSKELKVTASKQPFNF